MPLRSDPVTNGESFPNQPLHFNQKQQQQIAKGKHFEPHFQAGVETTRKKENIDFVRKVLSWQPGGGGCMVPL